MTAELRLNNLDSMVSLGEVVFKYKYDKDGTHKYYTDSNSMDVIERPLIRDDAWK